MFSFITSRRVSVLIVITYLVLFAIAKPPRSAVDILDLLLMTGYFLLPLACIWYSDEMGEYVGTFPGPGINRRSPGWMVKLGGWFLLLLPAIIGLFLAASS